VVPSRNIQPKNTLGKTIAPTIAEGLGKEHPCEGVLARSKAAPGTSANWFINPRLTLFRGFGLKRGNLLLHPGASAFWAPELFLLVFRNSHG
jgi:hypothetical protein